MALRPAQFAMRPALLVAAALAVAGGLALSFSLAANGAGELVEGPAESACGTVAAGQWTVDGETGSDWAVYTNATTCDAALQRAAELAGKGIVDMASAEGLRCTANDLAGTQVLSGICYHQASPAIYLSWGAATPAYEHPVICELCTGVPGQNAATFFDLQQ